MSTPHARFGLLRALGDEAHTEQPLSEIGVPNIEIDLQPDHFRGIFADPGVDIDEHRSFVSDVAEWCWGPAIAAMLADAALLRPSGLISSQPPALPEVLWEAGWRVSDLRLLTSVSPMSVPEAVPWCLRPARLLYGETGSLVVWHPLADGVAWQADSPLVAPLPECKRRHSFLTEIHGHGGTEHVARLVQDALQHQDWTLWQLTQRVERWERLFFHTAREGTFFEGFHAESLAESLDDIPACSQPSVDSRVTTNAAPDSAGFRSRRRIRSTLGCADSSRRCGSALVACRSKSTLSTEVCERVGPCWLTQPPAISFCFSSATRTFSSDSRTQQRWSRRLSLCQAS